jgi:hypothetical protein
MEIRGYGYDTCLFGAMKAPNLIHQLVVGSGMYEKVTEVGVAESKAEEEEEGTYRLINFDSGSERRV